MTTKPAQAQLDRIGEDAICERIASGDSIRQILDEARVSFGAYYEWLRSTPERSARVRLAMEASAEAWRDKGTAVLESALRKDSQIDPNAARAYAQDCAQRAAIRNPLYRDKQPEVNVNVGIDAINTSAGNVLAAAVALARQHGLESELRGLVIENPPQSAALPQPDKPAE